MSPERQVYLLDPQHLPPETIAVTFAKTSRSPQSFREIAAELTEEKSAEFHDRWVVGYGHSSVAEHAILHIAVENISRLAGATASPETVWIITGAKPEEKPGGKRPSETTPSSSESS